MRETQVRSLVQEDPLEKGLATHSSILVLRIPLTEEPGSLQFMESQGVRHDWVTELNWTDPFPQLSLFVVLLFQWGLSWLFCLNLHIHIHTHIPYTSFHAFLPKSKRVSHSVMPNPLQPHGLQSATLLCPWISPGKNTGVGCQSLLQGAVLIIYS